MLANAREAVVKLIAPTSGPRAGGDGAVAVAAGPGRLKPDRAMSARAEAIEGDHFLTADDEMAEGRSPAHEEEAHYDDRRSRHEAEDDQEDGDDDELREGNRRPAFPLGKRSSA